MDDETCEDAVDNETVGATPDLLFRSTSIDGVEDPLRELADDAKRQGYAVASQEQPDGQARMGIEWLALTTFAVILFAPARDDLYQWLKRRVPRLWRQFYDRTNPRRIRGQVLTPRGAVRREHSSAISIWAEFRHGRVKLLLPDECSEQALRLAVSAFAGLMTAYAHGETYEGIDLDAEPNCYDGVIVVAYGSDAQELRVLNPYHKLDAAQLANARRLERERRGRIEPTVGQPRRPDEDS